MKRAVRATVAFVVLAAFTIGMPAFLVKAVGNPWPGRLAFQIRNDHALIVAGLAVVCWLAWARLVVAVVTETVRALRWYRSQPHPEHLTNPTAPTVPLPAGGGAVGPLVFRLVVAILVVLPTVSRATPARATVTSADPVMRPPAVTRTVTSSERSSPDTTPAR